MYEPFRAILDPRQYKVIQQISCAANPLLLPVRTVGIAPLTVVSLEG